MTIEEGTAHGEAFERGTAALRFEGRGIRLDGIEMQKGGGTFTGAAFVGWDGTYSFQGDGRRLALEEVALAASTGLPLTGIIAFSADGSGTFRDPIITVEARIDDVFLADEGVGQVTGRLIRRGPLLTLELDAASPRLAVSGAGRIALTSTYDSDLTLRFSETSLDPYLRTSLPRLSPFTTAIGTGTIHVVGELADCESSARRRHVRAAAAAAVRLPAAERRADPARPGRQRRAAAADAAGRTGHGARAVGLGESQPEAGGR